MESFTVVEHLDVVDDVTPDVLAGVENGKLALIDELLTPDSSRFWDAELYKVGQSQPSYDKQPVRDWLTRSGWNKAPPAPMLPDEVIESTARIFRTAYERLTGKKLE